MEKFQGDDTDDPKRLARDFHTYVRPYRRQYLAGEAQGFPSEELEDLSGADRFPYCLGKDIPLLAGQQ